MANVTTGMTKKKISSFSFLFNSFPFPLLHKSASHYYRKSQNKKINPGRAELFVCSQRPEKISLWIEHTSLQMEGHLKLRLQSLSIECRGVAPTWSKDVNQINQFSILSPTLDQN